MDTDGMIAPDTEAAARETYDELAPAAGEVVRAIAKEMEFDSEEYSNRVGGGVVDTARDAIFASLLEVSVGSRDEYESWCSDHECDPVEVGSENVENVVWHAAPFVETVVAATFQDEREAAVSTLRRQAFGRIYSDLLNDGE